MVAVRPALTATAYAYCINRGTRFGVSPGEFEAITRKDGQERGQSALYVRYVGGGNEQPS